MVQNRERQPHNQLRIRMSIRMSYGLQLTLALVGGACLDLPKHECTRDLGLRRRARVRWRTDQPSYRDKGTTGLLFLTRKC